VVIAVLADIVGSRKLRDRAAAQRVIDETVAIVERQYPAATVPLTPTVGDELQSVYSDLGAALTSLLLLQLALPDPVQLRFGIGIGDVHAIESTHATLSDGPGWWAARAAIDVVHTKQQRDVPRARTWIVPAPGQDEVVATTIDASNAYLLARDELVGAMNERERRLTFGRMSGKTQQELAEQEHITQPSVSKSLRRVGAAALIEGMEQLKGNRA